MLNCFANLVVSACGIGQEMGKFFDEIDDPLIQILFDLFKSY